MSELFASLGLNAKMLVAQLINFAILLFVLHRFVYTPIVRILAERTDRIEKGLAQADEAQKKLEAVTEKERAILAEAKREAREIVAAAQKQAEENRARLAAAAQDESARMIAATRTQMDAQKAQLEDEIKKDIAALVVVAVEKVVGQRMDATMDHKIIADALAKK